MLIVRTWAYAKTVGKLSLWTLIFSHAPGRSL